MKEMGAGRAQERFPRRKTFVPWKWALLRSQNNTEIPNCPKPAGQEKPHVQGHQAALVHGFPRHLWFVKQKRCLIPNTSGVMSLMGQHPAESPCEPDKRLELEGLPRIPGQTETRWG